MRNYNTMLHMKLNSAVCLTALLAFLPSSAFAGICFLPDCQDEDVVQGDFNMNLNEDTEFCEKEGYTYYTSGECPQYYAKIGTCSRDDHYLKCDAAQWCKDNGYNTTSCSIPQYVDGQCPNGKPYYKQCKTDNDRACKELGYTKTCSSGQKLYQNSGRCAYDSSYGTCCTPSGCPSYTSTSYSSYGTNGTDGCEYTCYYTCDMDCPSGTSTSNPGGCGGSTRNGCGNKTCYYPYEACCYPYSSETGCSCGTYSCSDGCGGTRTCCSTCPEPDEPEEDPCDYSGISCSYGCASYDSCGKCSSCKSAPPKDDEEDEDVDPCEGVTGKSCSSGYHCSSYGSCGECTACEKDKDPCEGVTGKSCSSGYHCSSYGSCGECTACEKDKDPCEGVTGKSCSSGYHCSSYGSCGECTACEKDADPCAGVTCSTAKSCSYGCASYSTATSCCSSVCISCKSKPSTGSAGTCTPGNCGHNENFEDNLTTNDRY